MIRTEAARRRVFVVATAGRVEEQQGPWAPPAGVEAIPAADLRRGDGILAGRLYEVRAAPGR